MAHFLQPSVTVPVKRSTTITLWGSGPSPTYEELKVVPVVRGIVKVSKAKPPTKRADPHNYYWEVSGQTPGVTKLEALTVSKLNWAKSIDVTVTGRIIIKFEKNGEGTLECVGLGTFRVLGQPGRQYPEDLIVKPSDKERVHQSIEFEIDMPWAIKIWGQKGIFIHEMPDNLADNEGPTAGCIHLSEENAPKVYNYVKTRTRVTIEAPWLKKKTP
jgi:L,D-transpeptidase catalytic domain.